ncbi:MAG: polysaccharide deacetylase family protein [Pseudomonadota bacterium]
MLFRTIMIVAAALPLAALAAPFHWPPGVQAAISLAYDDALDSQLDHAIPVLDRYGIKASFYLQLSSAVVAQRLPAWRAAAARGHELGNHTLFHQCRSSEPERSWVQPQRDLDTTSVAQMRDQVVLANTMLFAIDGQRERTFTVPCGDTLAAGQDYLPAIRNEFVAIKSGGGGIAAMAVLDPYAVPVAAPVQLSGKQLIAMVEAAAAGGTMLNLTFHGIGGDYLSVSSEAHEELVRYLAANRRRLWTDTFLNIMKYVKHQQ